MSRKRVTWTVVVAVLASGSLALAALIGLVDDATEVGIFLAGVAAVAGVGSLVITAIGNATNARHLAELADQQEQAATDIRRLAELTETSLEEARAQTPEPVVRFVVEKTRVSAEAAIWTRKRFARELDIERTVAAERQAALATLPPPEPPEPAETPDPGLDEQGVKPAGFGGLAGLAGLANAANAANIARISATLSAALGVERGPISEEERREFTRRVDAYAGTLRAWLRGYLDYRRQSDPSFALLFRFENVGRVPARGVRVDLRFPDGFKRTKPPEPVGDRPRRPRFHRRRVGPLSALDRALLAPSYPGLARDLRVPTIPLRRNVSGPRYRDGSLIVEFEIEKLRHGIPEDAEDAVWLAIAHDGDYTVPWEIHAENLAVPVSGELRLQIVTEHEEGPPIISLAELVALLPKAEDASEEDEG